MGLFTPDNHEAVKNVVKLLVTKLQSKIKDDDKKKAAVLAVQSLRRLITKIGATPPDIPPASRNLFTANLTVYRLIEHVLNIFVSRSLSQEVLLTTLVLFVQENNPHRIESQLHLIDQLRQIHQRRVA